MVGRATFTMKKSTSGSAAPISTVNSPSPPSTGAGWSWRATGVPVAEVFVSTDDSLTPPTLDRYPAWYQSLFILVPGAPGDTPGRSAGWEHDDHADRGVRDGRPAQRARRLPPQPSRADHARAGRAT